MATPIQDAEQQLALLDYSKALKIADRICGDLRSELGSPGVSRARLPDDQKAERLDLAERTERIAATIASKSDGGTARKAQDILRRLEPVKWEYRRPGQPTGSVVLSIAVEQIEILTGKPDRPYREIGQVNARASAPTAFNRAPSLDEVNGKLREKAAEMGATAVIAVRYDRGPDLFSWKAVHAAGIAVVIEADEKVCPYCAETIKAAAIKCRFCGSDLTTADAGPF